VRARVCARACVCVCVRVCVCVCVCVCNFASVIRHTNRIFSAQCILPVWQYHISPHYLINDKIFEKKLIEHHHHHKHRGLDPLIRSVSTVTAARANASSVFQLFSFLVVCSGMISKALGFVVFFASVEASSVCIHLSCLVCL